MLVDSAMHRLFQYFMIEISCRFAPVVDRSGNFHKSGDEFALSEIWNRA
jgi:hypothetical protein